MTCHFLQGLVLCLFLFLTLYFMLTSLLVFLFARPLVGQLSQPMKKQQNVQAPPGKHDDISLPKLTVKKVNGPKHAIQVGHSARVGGKG